MVDLISGRHRLCRRHRFLGWDTIVERHRPLGRHRLLWLTRFSGRHRPLGRHRSPLVVFSSRETVFVKIGYVLIV